MTELMTDINASGVLLSGGVWGVVRGLQQVSWHSCGRKLSLFNVVRRQSFRL